MRKPEYAIAVVAAFVLAAASAFASAPALIIESSARESSAAAALRNYDREKLERVASMIGGASAQQAIEVVVVPEDSVIAQRTPDWIAGYTPQNASVVFLFPARVGRYPDDGLEELLFHEVAHVLIDRATGGNEIPRWFNEAVATTIGRNWTLQDWTRFGIEQVSVGRVAVDQLDAMFLSGPPAANHAYVIAGAFTRFLMQRDDPQVIARILRQIGSGTKFQQAFVQATGTSLDAAMDQFWRSQPASIRAIPFLTSEFTLWTGITILAIIAIALQQHRNAMRKRAQAELDALDDEDELVN